MYFLLHIYTVITLALTCRAQESAQTFAAQVLSNFNGHLCLHPIRLPWPMNANIQRGDPVHSHRVMSPW